MVSETASTISGDTFNYAPVKKMYKEHSSRSLSPYNSDSESKNLSSGTGDVQEDEEGLQELLGYRFNDVGVLRQALTHKSLGDNVCNQKMEWLGDSVLQLAVSEELYRRFASRPDISEGELTTARVFFVRGETLRKMAAELSLCRWLKTAKGVSQVFVDKMQEDMVEALLGAIMLDGGYDAAKACVVKMFRPSDWGDSMCAALDHKSELQNLIANLQSGGCPIYEVMQTSGPSNNTMFTVRVRFEKSCGFGNGTSKLKAEQAAANDLLNILRSKGTQPVNQHAKSELLELCHKEHIQLPTFSTMARFGPDHSEACSESSDCHCEVKAYFECECKLSYRNEDLVTIGKSINKKGAEKIASDLMLKTMRNSGLAEIGSVNGAPNQQYPSAKPHPKSFLMELSSKHQHAPPQFEIIEETLPKFSVRCSYPDLQIVRIAEAASKKVAEKLVAEMVLQDVLRSAADQ